MSSSKKNLSLAEQISDVLKPKVLADAETDQVEARIEDFEESSSRHAPLSEIRKQNAKSLSELDQKYEGVVSSRKEDDFDLSDDDVEESGSDEAEDSDDPDDSEQEDEEIEEESEEGSGEDDDEDDGSDEDGSDEDNFDVSQFARAAPGEQQVKNEIIKDTSLNEEILKGVSVQNQQKLWEKILEIRIKSHKILTLANGLPDADAHLELVTLEDTSFSEKAEETCENVHNLMDKLLELQKTLVTSFPDSKNLLKRKSDQNGNGGFLKRSKLAEYSDIIEERHDQYLGFRNDTLQRWYERTKTVKDLKSATEGLKFSTKIENALLGKREMIRKSQLYRGDYEIFGVPKIEKDEDEIQIPEIFDDSEFYHQLLRELIEQKSTIDENHTDIAQKYKELQKVRSKMKKKVDTRASKGRKIRYVVHNKLVNFMPVEDNSEWTDEARRELFDSLFGKLNSL